MPESKRYVPAGGQVLTPYICPRDAGQAIDWYVATFGAVESSARFVDKDGRVGHAEITIDGATIMLSDAYPDYGGIAPPPGNTTATFALSLFVPDADATVAAAKSAGAVVQRPVEEQFHGARMGTLVDPFGVRWMISTQVREVGAAELARAAAEFSDTGAPPGPIDEP
jgi:PhnB protein